MNPQRLAQGEKRARRVLHIWRACQRKSAGQWERDWLADDGPAFQVMRYTRVPCSCVGCGNPRRHFGTRTRQERQAEDRMRAELDDMQHDLPLPWSKLVQYWDDTPWERAAHALR